MRRLVLVHEQQEDKGGGPLDAIKAECRDDEDSAARFVEMIDDEYRVHWVLDNLPVAVNEYEEAEHSLWRNSFRIDMLERTGKFLDQHTRPTETSSGEANPGATSASQFNTETVAFPSNG